MNSLSQGVSSPTSVQSNQFFHNKIKSLGSQTSAKALGAATDPALSQWYEDAYAYYQAVQTGQEPQPDTASWNEFLNQMNWAYQQLMGDPAGGWQPTEVGDPAAMGASTSTSDPFGAMMGTDGAWVHTEASAYVGFLGGQTRYFWSNDITIDVASLAAQVEVVKTMDESSEPPEEVLKVRIYDSATGTEDIYMIHDYADAQIEINTPDPDQVNDLTGEATPLFEVGEFEENGGEVLVQSSVPGEVLEDRENAYLYEGRVGQVIEFTPEGSGESGEVETHVVYGDSAIYTHPTDEVAVTQSDEGVILIEVTHRDGSVDVFEVQEGYHVDLFARVQTMTIDGTAFEDLEELPEGYGDYLGINGDSESTGASEYPEDTQPDRVESETAYFNSSDVVSLHNYYEGDVETYDIVTGGTVEIQAYNYEDQVSIYLEEDGSYRVEISNPEFTDTRIYHVEGPPSRIQLSGFLPAQVDAYRETDNVRGGVKIFNFLDGELSNTDAEDLEDLAVVQVLAENAALPSEAQAKADEEEANALEWPAGNIGNQITVSNGHADEALELIRMVEEAIASGNSSDWYEVSAFVNDLNKNTGNDVIRKFITALYKAMGSDIDALREVLDYIPDHVRETMMDKVVQDSGELDETHDGDLFNSQGAWDQLNVSLHDDDDD